MDDRGVTGRIVRTLGIKLGASGARNQIPLGWAVINQKLPELPEMSRVPMAGDHWAKMQQVLALAKEKIEPGDTVRLYRWSLARFPESPAAMEGGSFEDHLRLVSDACDQLQLAGFTVEIETLTEDP